MARLRPRIRLLAPAAAQTGERVAVTVCVESPDRLRVRRIDLTVRGVDSWRSPGQRSHERGFFRAITRLCGPRTLPAGSTSFGATVVIPGDAPPSHGGLAGSTSYWLTVRVALPFWGSVDELCALRIEPGPARAEHAQAEAKGDETRCDEPRCEIGIASVAVSPGQVVRGWVSFHDTDRLRVLDTTVSARAVEELVGWTGRHEVVEVLRVVTSIVPGDLREDHSRSFCLWLPADAPVEVPDGIRPDGGRSLYRLRWDVEVRTREEGRSVQVVRAPLRVVAGRGPAPAKPPLAETGCLICARALALRKQRPPIGEVGPTSIRISKTLGPTGKGRLEAFVDFPSLGLGLGVGLAPVDGGSAPWASEERFRLRARDREQSLAALDVLFGARSPTWLVWLDDEVLRLAANDLHADERLLGALLDTAVACARAIDERRGRLPVPTGLTTAAEVWRELAALLEGSLEPGPMRIEGRWRERPCAVWLAFDEAGRPSGTWLRAGEPAEEPHAHPPAENGRLEGLLRPIAARCAELVVDALGVSARCRGVLGLEDGPTTEGACSLLDELARLVSSVVEPPNPR